MWKRCGWMCMVLIALWVYHTEAQNTQPGATLPAGVLVEPVNQATLCVIDTQNDGPQWFLLNADGPGRNERIGSISAALGLISDIKASADGKYLAVLSVGEGHPLLEVIDLPILFQKKTYTVLHKIDPYPGSVSIRSWDGGQLQLDSDVLLTRLDPKTGRVPSELVLSSSEIFALNALTGQITGVSEGVKNPIIYYSKILMDPRASEAQKDAALSMLLTLNPDEATVSYLLKALEQEQDARRILKLLEQINKLRGK